MGIVGALGGAVLGWYLHRWTRRDLLRISAIKDEITKALGPLYSIVHQTEISTTQGVKIVEKEKKELDRIVATYPHMLSNKIRLQWLSHIRNLEPLRRTSRRDLRKPVEYAISVDFRKIVVEEFCNRLAEYFEATGQSERLSKIDEYRKPYE